MRHPERLTPKSKTHTVTPGNDGFSYHVTSGTSGTMYRVWRSGQVDAWMCSCEWAQYRPVSNGGKCGCSHVLSVIAYIQDVENGRSIQAYNDRAAAEKQHRKIQDIGDGIILCSRLVKKYD